MKSAASLILVLVFTVVVAGPAHASHGGPHNVTQDGAQILGRGTGGGNGGGDGGGSNNGTNGGRARPVVNTEPIYKVGLGETDDGEGGTTRCWRIETGGSQTLARARETLNSFDNNGTLYDACPRAQRVPTIEERVRAQFERWSPAPVTAQIEPGYAITGLRAYLEINDPTPESITLVGQTVSLAKEYRVRWGDGATTTTSSKGVPYPGGDGEITHVYANAGNVTVEVDLVVTGSWNGRNLGSLAPVTGRLPLEIWQVQAVRKR
jgi:hypothetical protein